VIAPPPSGSVRRFASVPTARVLEADESPSVNPLATWVPDQESEAILVADQRLVILPSQRIGVIVPPEEMGRIDWRGVILANDFGPLYGLPPVGAGASRVFRAGPRLGVMLDAGRNPQRQPAAVYLDHVAARMRDLGINEIRSVLLIHRHSDHANEVVRIVREHGIGPGNVIIPRAFLQQDQGRGFAQTLAGLRGIFGPNWQPADISLKPSPTNSQLYAGRYALGETRFEFLADARALRHSRHTDSASLLTRVLRPSEGLVVPILGDLRGEDLMRFRSLMGADRWTEYFRDVQMVDGFSHHRGAITTSDVPGLMALLDATLLRRGRLAATLQTDPGEHVAARADTLELMRRIGIKVDEAHVAQSITPAGVRASSGRATTIGPGTASPGVVESPLTTGLARLERLVQARDVVTLWEPQAVRLDPGRDYSAEQRLIAEAIESLRGSLREAIKAAMSVRTADNPTARNYNAGPLGAAYADALRKIPVATPAETAIGPDIIARLASMHGVPASEIRLRILLRDALVNGRYSPEAFRYMLDQLHPSMRRGLFSGNREQAAKAWERIRAQFGFEQSTVGLSQLPGAAHLRAGPVRTGARGVAGLLILVELANIVGQVVETRRIASNMAYSRNVAPFLRRIAFWRQLRGQSAEVGVNEGLTGQEYARDPVRIEEGLASGKWDYLYMEHTDSRPALSDAEIIQVLCVLGYNVRNYDEYATLFIDSFQDAVRWVNGTEWTKSRWEVRVAHFETRGTNRLVERWVELPRFTEGMRALCARVIAGTGTLLQRLARGLDSSSADTGTLHHPDGPLLYRARPGAATTTSTVELRVKIPAQWGSTPSPKTITHVVTWPRNAELFVWAETPTYVQVTGANFGTYAALRGLRSERYEVAVTQWSLNDLRSSPTGNENGDVWMLRSEIGRLA
jgi:hypothetical protein